MTTKLHKMLVDLVARKMREKGYSIVAKEGNLLKFPESEKTTLPFVIKRHRPDVIGVQMASMKICIGEAKTADDLFSKRTAEQFSDFANVIGGVSGQNVELIIGIPLRSQERLLQLLTDLGLTIENISIVILPEELVDDKDNENLI